VTCELARQVGLVGVRRVLDSAPLEDACRRSPKTEEDDQRTSWTTIIEVRG
jgi:hypothetical protein